MRAKLLKHLFKFNYLNEFGRRQVHSEGLCLKPELELAFNNQINMEFFASFTYLAMAAFFGRRNVALPGCQKYFMDQVLDEREHAQKLINYVNRRGNTVSLQAIEPPKTQSWESPLAAFKDAVELEHCVTQKIHELYRKSEEMGDVCSCALLENYFIENQVEEADRLSRHITQLENIGTDGWAIFMFDRCLLKDTNKLSS